MQVLPSSQASGSARLIRSVVRVCATACESMATDSIATASGKGRLNVMCHCRCSDGNKIARYDDSVAPKSAVADAVAQAFGRGDAVAAQALEAARQRERHRRGFER